jgi:hypothetical protein
MTSGQTGTCDSGTNTCNYTCPTTAPQSCTLGGTATCIASGACCKDTDCTGSCMACNTTTHTCGAAKNEADPTGRCAGTCDSTGACKSKLGQTCTTTTGGCLSGNFCSADNYCCGTACGGTGTCAGTCSTGTCMFPTTACAGNSCSGNSVVGASTCNAGVCQAPTAVACGTHQTCTGAVGSATCSCRADPVCGAIGSMCASASTLAACSQDAQSCFYETSSSMCTNGACTGGPGAATCCTNACTSGATQCLSGSTLQTCGVGSNGCTVFTSSTCATALVCERYAPPGCVDPTWAEWPMPNNPTEVRAGAPNQEAYADNADGTVTDKVTGLMWQQVESSGVLGSQAAAHCTSLALAGHSDWRLPSRIELVSLVDYSLDSGLESPYFPAPAASTTFWSSSSPVGEPAYLWSVYAGNVASFNVGNSFNVRCVR